MVGVKFQTSLGLKRCRLQNKLDITGRNGVKNTAEMDAEWFDAFTKMLGWLMYMYGNKSD